MQIFSFFEDDLCIHLKQKRIMSGTYNSIEKEAKRNDSMLKDARGYLQDADLLWIAWTRTKNLVILRTSQEISFPRDVYIEEEFKELQSWQPIPNSAAVLWFSPFWCDSGSHVMSMTSFRDQSKAELNNSCVEQDLLQKAGPMAKKQCPAIFCNWPFAKLLVVSKERITASFGA